MAATNIESSNDVPPATVNKDVDEETTMPEHHPLIIVGGGIGGLVLALCLNQEYNHTKKNSSSTSSASSSATATTPNYDYLPIHVYESTAEYRSDAGGAIGLYANGLRVLRNLSNANESPTPNLLANVREAGCDYLFRRWMRHDGTEVAVAREDELLPDVHVHSVGAASTAPSASASGTTTTVASATEASSSSFSLGTSVRDLSRRFSGLLLKQPSTSAAVDSTATAAGNSVASVTDTAESTATATATATTTTATTEQPPPLAVSGSSLPDPEGKRAMLRPRGGSLRGSLGVSARRITGMLVDLNNGNNADTTTIATSTATAAAAAATTTTNTNEPKTIIETELLSLGIRRWKYQQVLYEACMEAGIHIHFGKRLQNVTSIPSSDQDGGSDNNEAPLTCLHFKDGSKVTASLVIGADGINSKVRNYVTNPMPNATANHSGKGEGEEEKEFIPEYTGVTCLMGSANVPRIRGICFPASATTKCHACYYPTRVPKDVSNSSSSTSTSTSSSTSPANVDDASNYEQVFQIYFPSPVERPDTWRTLTPEEAKEECRELAKKLREDGWDEQFLAPLESDTLTGVLRVGLRSREALDVWHVGGNTNAGGDGGEKKGDDDDDDVANPRDVLGRAVLLGDAAHPPVPYIGQGAMMAMEDAGTLALLLGHFCPMMSSGEGGNDDATPQIPDFSQFKTAMQVYESLRVLRTKTILGSSVQLGKTQQKRAESKLYNAWREWSIKAQVWAYGTLPVMRPGAAFDYKAKVEEALAKEKEGKDAV